MSLELALDIGGTKLAAALVGPDGSLVGRRSDETRGVEGGEAVLGRALALAAQVLGCCPEGEAPSALGVASKGLTREDGVRLSGMGDWSRLRIPGMLRSRFPGLELAVVNDVKAATLAEMTWGRLRGVADALYVNLGTGIAAGIVAGGELVEGANGAAGEIGYLFADRAQLCRHRRPDEELVAPLEARVGGVAVPARSLERLGEALTMEELVARARADVSAAALVEELIEEIVLWIVNVGLVLDPERVVIGGGFLRADPGLCRRIAEAFGACAPFPPEVHPAHFGTDSALVGAGALAQRLAARRLPPPGSPPQRLSPSQEQRSSA